MNPLIEKAITFAMDKHRGQKRDDGQDYVTHPRTVAQLITRVAPDDINLIAAAWLHDTLEDTDTTKGELLDNFGEDVAMLVWEVTKAGQKDHKGYFFPNLTTRRGIVLKFADRLANLADMKSWPDARQHHYLEKSKFWESE